MILSKLLGILLFCRRQKPADIDFARPSRERWIDQAIDDLEKILEKSERSD